MKQPKPKPKVVIAAGGAIETALLPSHLARLAPWRDVFEIQIALSDGGARLVSAEVLQTITANAVYTSARLIDPALNEPFHISLASCDLLVIFPATARIVAAMALGIVECPVTRLFAFADKPRVVITPYLHPAMSLELYRPHLATLSSLGCKLILPARADDIVWREENAWLATERHLLQRMGVNSAFHPAPTVSFVRDRASGTSRRARTA